MLFSSLFLAAVTIAEALAAPAPNAEPASEERGVGITKRKNFWFAGVNESGAEFGNGNLPGTKGTDYTWPLTSTVDVRYSDYEPVFPLSNHVTDFDGQRL